jgi:hypothetical protein
MANGSGDFRWDNGRRLSLQYFALLKAWLEVFSSARLLFFSGCIHLDEIFLGRTFMRG